MIWYKRKKTGLLSKTLQTYALLWRILKSSTIENIILYNMIIQDIGRYSKRNTDDS